MSVVKLGWSGGKDSTAAAYLHLENDDYLKIVYYIPMFTSDIPLILNEHYDFILRQADKFKSLGADVYRAYGITYYDYCTTIASRGKYKGLPFGFPYFIRGNCGFKRDSKLVAFGNIDVGYFDYVSVGIAFDEFDRHSLLNDLKRSILVEKEYTESDCINLCYSKNAYSPHYKYSSRDGCVLCPNSSLLERNLWFAENPDAVDIVLELQNNQRKYKPGTYPLRNYQWFINDERIQLSFF